MSNKNTKIFNRDYHLLSLTFPFYCQEDHKIMRKSSAKILASFQKNDPIIIVAENSEH